MHKQGATDAAVLLLGRRRLGYDFDHVSALQDLVWERFLARNGRWSRLRDGNDRLPEAFAQRLGARLHYGAELRSLTQDRKAVRLGIAHEGTLAQVEVERAVIAIPFSVLRHVELDNSFSSAKRAVVARTALRVGDPRLPAHQESFLEACQPQRLCHHRFADRQRAGRLPGSAGSRGHSVHRGVRRPEPAGRPP